MAADSMKREMRLHRDQAHLCESIAAAIERRVKESIAARGCCHFALAGGRTPLPLFDLLAEEYADRLPWDLIHLYWGDERWVATDDPESNYGNAKIHLVDRVPIPPSQVHPMTEGQSGREDAVQRYDQLLRSTMGTPPRFDIMLLGMGADGHTASIFPQSEALTEQERFVLPVQAPIPPVERMTLTLEVINQARHIYFLVVGGGKSEALQCAFGQRDSIPACPARFIEPVDGNVVWWVDAEAAEGL